MGAVAFTLALLGINWPVVLSVLVAGAVGISPNYHSLLPYLLFAWVSRPFFQARNSTQ